MSPNAQGEVPAGPIFLERVKGVHPILGWSDPKEREGLYAQTQQTHVMCHAGAQGVLAKLQDCMASAAEHNTFKGQRCSLADLLGLCLEALAYISELSLSKDPAALAELASGPADPLTNDIMKVRSSTMLLSQHLKLMSGPATSYQNLRPVLSCTLHLSTL